MAAAHAFDACSIVQAMPGPRSASPSANTDRAISDLVREGVVETVDTAKGTAVVRIGDILTPPCPWSMAVGDTTIWIPLTVGQSVTVCCPEGDIERAFITGSLPSSSMPPLGLGNQVAIRFKDGATIAYDPDVRQLSVSLPGEAIIIAPSGMTLQADVTIEGDVTVSGDVACAGTVTGTADVVGAGKSLKGHRHTGVTAGSGVTGAPQ